MKREDRLKAYARMLGAAIGLCAAIFWLITGEKPPNYADVLKEFS